MPDQKPKASHDIRPKATVVSKGSRLKRQEPGAMGLGTSEAVPLKPTGWKPPQKPDLMTKNTKGRHAAR